MSVTSPHFPVGLSDAFSRCAGQGSVDLPVRLQESGTGGSGSSTRHPRRWSCCTPMVDSGRPGNSATNSSRESSTKGFCGDRSRTRKVIGPEDRVRHGRHFHLVLAAWEVGGPGACGRADRHGAGSPDHGRLPCRGASHILTTSLAGKPGATSRLPADADSTGIRPALLLRTSDAQGAVLYPEEGYALIAETAAFMAAAVNEHRHSTRTLRPSCARSPETSSLTHGRGHLSPPGQRAWSHPGDVAPGSPGSARGSLRPSVHDPRGLPGRP